MSTAQLALIITGVLGILAVLAVTFLVIPAIQRAEELTPEEQEIVDLFARMHEEDTGGLLALPVYDTTVQIAAVDRRAAVRTLTVDHDDAPRPNFAPNRPVGVTPPDIHPSQTPPVRQVQLMQRAGRPSPGVYLPSPVREDAPAAVTPPALAVADGAPTDSPAAAAPLPPGPAAAGPPDAPVPVSEPSGATGPAPAAITDVDGDESPWEHETSWFSLDAILADADARAGAE